MKPKADPASIRRQQGQLLAADGPSPRLLTEFIDLQHPLVLLAERIEWESFDPQWQECFSSASGPKASSSRLAAGLLMLKHMEGLSDERLIEAWVCNPYYQHFCGETHFQHRLWLIQSPWAAGVDSREKCGWNISSPHYWRVH